MSLEITSYVQGRRGGRAPWSPPYARLPWEGNSWEGGSLNITSGCISLPQAIYILHWIALHSPKRLRKEIYSDSQQYHSKLCLIKYWNKYPCFSTRVTRVRNDGEMKVSKVHRTCHTINGGSLEITHLFHLSIITSCNKKYLKISLSP